MFLYNVRSIFLNDYLSLVHNKHSSIQNTHYWFPVITKFNKNLNLKQ